MYIHKEGHKMLTIVGAIILVIYAAMIFTVHQWNFFHFLFITILLVFWCLLLYFFRIPRRVFTEDETRYISPADGSVCAIEEVYEKEYLNCDCMQVSIFMNGTDVHVNRYPVSGKIDYVKYHKGNYFVASYPKSSVLNEHSSIGMTLDNGQRILIRQVAGVMARRIVCYAHEGETVRQNQEMGFIKFGSRIDLFLPIGTALCVDLQDVVRNGVTPLAEVPIPSQNNDKQ